MELQDKVAVVTGAGSGIGRATARLLAERGCNVALVDLHEERIAETAALIRTPTSTHVADVSDAERMAALPDEVLAQHGACHVLVNNAGVTAAGGFDEDDLDLIHWIMGINVWGVLHGCKFFLPVLRAQPQAHVVNVSSMVAFVGLPQNAAYSMSKGAVRSFTEALRAELITTGVGVTSVHPGSIRTNIMRDSRGSQAELLSRLGQSRAAQIALRSPDAVARGIVKGIEQNRARILVGADARILDVAARVAPGRSGFVGRLVHRATRARP